MSFSYTILANPEVEPPNTYQLKLVPGDSIDTNISGTWLMGRYEQGI